MPSLLGFDLHIDRYTLLAQQRPALLMLFPSLVAAVALFPSLRAWWAALIAIAGTCGVSIALGHFAQSLGKSLEPRLIEAWGGLPSVAMLRHRDNRIDDLTKERYKRFLAGAVQGGLLFPTKEDEEADQSAADEVYKSASRWLLSQTRDTKRFALLFQQNINYGYRRNLLGLKLWGIALGVAPLLIVGAGALLKAATGQPFDSTYIVALMVAAAALAFWLFAVREGWVKIAADAYALELLGACDRLSSSTQAPARKSRTKKANPQ